MPSINRRLLALVDDVAASQCGLITSSQLVEIGVPSSTLRYRIRQGGPWRRVLPRVYAVSPGPLSDDQRELAALLYVGPPALLTGTAALRHHGISAARSLLVGEIHVLVPNHRKRASTHFVHVQRALYWPDTGANGFAPVTRAAIDTCRALDRRQDVEAVLSEVVRDRHASIDDLETELGRAQRRRSALAREALRELRAGPVSVPELELARRWRRSGLPPALFNVDLHLPTGEFVGRPDAYVAESGVVVEVESRGFHYSPRDWDRTMRRHARMTATGLAVLHVTPTRVRDDFGGIVREMWSVVESQVGRTLPNLEIRTRHTG